MRHSAAPLGTALGLLCALSAYADPPTLRTQPITKPIQIDGALGDAGWTEATPVELGANKPGVVNKYKTQAWLGYGQNDLFVAFRCEEPAQPMPGKADGLETSVFAGDTVEVFLNPSHDRRNYWHFAVDPYGLRYDGIGMDSTAAAVWDVKTRVGDGEWTAEFRIPFRSLGITPATTPNWTGNLCRMRHERPGEPGMYWSLTPMPHFHCPDQFAEITNIQPNFERFFLLPAQESLKDIESRLGVLDGRVAALGLSQDRASELLDRARQMAAEAKRIGADVANYKRAGNRPFEELAALQKQVVALDRQVGLLLLAKRSGRDIEKADFLTGVENGIVRIYSDRDFEGQITSDAALQLARNEYEGFQLVIIPLGKTLRDVRVQAGDLEGPQGARIAASEVDVRPVLEAIIDRGADGSLWPDILGPAGPVAVAKSLQPFMATIHARGDLPAGEYRGVLRVQARDAAPAEVRLVVTVWDLTLPKETHCHTGLFDVQEMAVCAHLGLKMFSKPFDDRMREIFEYFARHRIQPGGTTPVSSRSQWWLWQGEINPATKKASKYQAIATHADPNHKIWAPWSPEAVTYWTTWAKWWRDRGLPLGSIQGGILDLKGLRADPEPARRFLEAFYAVIHQRGWEQHCFIRYPDEIDEPGKDGPETVKFAGEFVKRYAPTLLRQSVQTGRTPQDPYLDYVDLWFIYSWNENRGLYERLIRQGKVFWLGSHDAMRVASPDLAPRLLGLTLRKFGFSGTGLWASTWNMVNPAWSNGAFHVPLDKLVNAPSLLLWPAPGDIWYSRRLELVRDGIEDFEYHWLLGNLIQKAEILQPRSPQLADALTAARSAYAIPDSLVADLQKCSTKPDDLLGYRKSMAEAIVRLQKSLPN